MAVSNRLLAALGLALTLSGCATVGHYPESNIGAVCPSLREYSKAETQAVLKELRQCGDKCKATKGFIKDYGVLRKQVRACRGA